MQWILSKYEHSDYPASKIGWISVDSWLVWPNSSWNSTGILNGTPTRKGGSKRPNENFSGLPSWKKKHEKKIHQSEIHWR